MSRNHSQVNGYRIATYCILVFVCLVALFPLVFMLNMSIKPTGESVVGIGSLITANPTLRNFVRITQIIPIARNFLNSVIVAVTGATTTVLFCSLGGFAFAKYNFPGKEPLFILMIATMMVPPETNVIPLFLIMRYLGWINNLLSLIVPGIATAIGIFYMRQYINSFPYSIMEQARIDGCREFRIFWNMVLPNITPALAAWGSIALIVRWNMLLEPLLFLRTREMYTLMVAISVLPVSEGLSTPWQVIMAGTAISVVPLIIVYFFLQRFQVAGLTTGALKG